ncbi:FkbM family methyltransferase [Candidatus Dojkabacteria bacterium]|nr:FkbM family methyltransferase [Candidatus Dojkabacteria bacterium]
MPTTTRKIGRLKTKINYRENTDDIKFTIPEVIDYDMFFLKELCKLEPDKPSIIIDGGAHIGTFTLMTALLTQRANLLSYEPNLENFKILKENTKDIKRISIFNEALGTKDTEAKLYGTIDSGHTGRFTLSKSDKSDTTVYQTVKVVNLNRIIEESDKSIFMLKLDLEGYEAEIIKNLSVQALDKIQILLFEEHHIPIDITKIENSGFVLAFNPFNQKRHAVYIKAQGNHELLEKILKISNLANSKNNDRDKEELLGIINEKEQKIQNMENTLVWKTYTKTRNLFKKN